MKSIFKSILFVGVMLMALSTSAQLTSGKVEYSFKLESDDEQMAMALAMMGNSTMTIEFDGANSRTTTDMGGMSKNVVIVDGSKEESLMLLEVPMMGMKKAIKIGEEDKKDETGEEDVPEITLSDKTKEIAGYQCKLAIVEMEDEEGNVQEMEIWYTDEISPDKFKSQYTAAGINGFMMSVKMEAETPQGAMTTFIEATKVSKEKPDADRFSLKIPDGYEEGTMEDLKGMGGM